MLGNDERKLDESVDSFVVGRIEELHVGTTLGTTLAAIFGAKVRTALGNIVDKTEGSAVSASDGEVVGFVEVTLLREVDSIFRIAVGILDSSKGRLDTDRRLGASEGDIVR